MTAARGAPKLARIALAVAVVLWDAAAGADIYAYRDATGEHFSNTPGPGCRLVRSTRAASRSAGGSARYTRYDAWIREAAEQYSIPEPLILAVIRQESDFDSRAVSPAGARGLMQLMPKTAERMGVRDAFDPRENIFGGVRLLRELANEFRGDLTLTLAAYNAGDAAVLQYAGVPPFPETIGYVAAVSRFYRRYRSEPDQAQTRLASEP
jgi:soluble lytic murein transglycosylase-like protein